MFKVSIQSSGGDVYGHWEMNDTVLPPEVDELELEARITASLVAEGWEDDYCESVILTSKVPEVVMKTLDSDHKHLFEMLICVDDLCDD